MHSNLTKCTGIKFIKLWVHFFVLFILPVKDLIVLIRIWNSYKIPWVQAEYVVSNILVIITNNLPIISLTKYKPFDSLQWIPYHRVGALLVAQQSLNYFFLRIAIIYFVRSCWHTRIRNYYINESLTHFYTLWVFKNTILFFFWHSSTYVRFVWLYSLTQEYKRKIVKVSINTLFLESLYIATHIFKTIKITFYLVSNNAVNLTLVFPACGYLTLHYIHTWTWSAHHLIVIWSFSVTKFQIENSNRIWCGCYNWTFFLDKDLMNFEVINPPKLTGPHYGQLNNMHACLHMTGQLAIELYVIVKVLINVAHTKQFLLIYLH